MRDNKQSKIVFLINSLTSGGAEKVLSVLVSELIKEGFEIELIALEKEEFYTIPKGVKRVYLSNFTNSDTGIKKMLYLPIYAWKLKKYIEENSIELVQSHIYRANFVNLLARLIGANHKVQLVEVIGLNFFKKRGFSNRVNLFLIKKLYKFSDLVIFKAKRMKSEFFKTLPYSLDSVVINNPYNIEDIQRLASMEIDEFRFESDKRYIINIGRLEPQKNQKILIELLTLLPSNIELIILGDGTQKKYLKELSEELHIESRVHLLGRQNNPYKFIKNSSLFILSSEEEGFPNVLIEAMVCGIPVISTDCISGPREILAPDSDVEFQLKEGVEFAKYGILCPVGDKQALVEAVNSLFEDKELYQNYSLSSLERSKEFSVKNIIKEYKEVLCVV